ncbi:MAG: DNA methyltransferase, partial [Actinobacteria bacterium]|nr:DNA methyltransferase [Actinomycetota bacterium]
MADGVRDLRAFLRIVARLRPRYWVFENVVRAAQIFEREVYSGSLREFAWLTPTVHVV